eukprot:403353685
MYEKLPATYKNIVTPNSTRIQYSSLQNVQALGGALNIMSDAKDGTLFQTEYFNDLAGNKSQILNFQTRQLKPQVILKSYFQDPRITILQIKNSSSTASQLLQIGIYNTSAIQLLSNQITTDSQYNQALKSGFLGLINFDKEHIAGILLSGMQREIMSDNYIAYFLHNDTEEGIIDPNSNEVISTKSRLYSLEVASSIPTDQIGNQNLKVYEIPTCSDELITEAMMVIVLCRAEQQFLIYSTKTLGAQNIQVKLTSNALNTNPNNVLTSSTLEFTLFKLSPNIPSQTIQVISRLNHNYIFFRVTNVTRNTTTQKEISKSYQLMMIEVIMNDKNPKDQYVSDSYKLIYKDDKRFNVENVQSNYLLIQRQNLQSQLFSYQFCFFDQYKTPLQGCQQCPIDSFSVSFEKDSCIKCKDRYAVANSLKPEQLAKLNFLCLNSIPQISRMNNYEQDTYRNPFKIANNSGVTQNQTQNTDQNGQIQPEDSSDSGSSAPIYVIVMIIIVPIVIIVIFSIILVRVIQIMKRNQRFRQENALRQFSQDQDQQRLERQRIKNEKRSLIFEKVQKMTIQSTFKKLTSNVYNLTECVICFEHFLAEDDIRVTQCNHIMHDKCLMEWARNKIFKGSSTESMTPLCPCCNASLLEIKPQSQINSKRENINQHDQVNITHSQNDQHTNITYPKQIEPNDQKRSNYRGSGSSGREGSGEHDQDRFTMLESIYTQMPMAFGALSSRTSNQNMSPPNQSPLKINLSSQIQSMQNNNIQKHNLSDLNLNEQNSNINNSMNSRFSIPLQRLSNDLPIPRTKLSLSPQLCKNTQIIKSIVHTNISIIQEEQDAVNLNQIQLIDAFKSQSSQINSQEENYDSDMESNKCTQKGKEIFCQNVDESNNSDIYLGLKAIQEQTISLENQQKDPQNAVSSNHITQTDLNKYHKETEEQQTPKCE